MEGSIMNYVVNYDDEFQDWLNANSDVWEQFILHYKKYQKFSKLGEIFETCVFNETTCQWREPVYTAEFQPPLSKGDFGFLEIEKIEKSFNFYCRNLFEQATNPSKDREAYISYIELYGVEKLVQVVGESKVKQVLGDYAIYC
jgi:hypothetical protein